MVAPSTTVIRSGRIVQKYGRSGVKINLREASTKRGIVWIGGGCYILWKAFQGQTVDSDALFDKLDFWLGVIMTIAGGFGLLPDEPKQLPLIELQAKPESGFNDAGRGVSVSPRPAPVPTAVVPAAVVDDGLRESELSANRRSESGAVGGNPPAGWNG